ncbi:MAG: enoyl-CoA hydratase/isomerase family protein [Planctomycetia bacterium]|nr:enoyl-CoA hydratase/isomerase family protein [Planctomycetia bacterium]MBL6914718.1 enoyl-CoA hydratase/isomerase family protein [Planctomycetota bacterium]
MPITVSSEIRRDLHVARVLLDSAPLNIIDLDQCDELLEALQGIRDDDEARVVIIQGEGHEFCSGTDIAEHTPEKMPDLLPRFHACLEAILSLDAIVIAAIEGRCLGGGLELAMACDRILVDEEATLGLPEIKIGCYPPAGLIQVLARSHPGSAVRMVCSGEIYPAKEFPHPGIIDELIPAGTMEEAIDTELDPYQELSPAILGFTARQFHRRAQDQWAKHLKELEAVYLEGIVTHEDSREGVEAFLEKRAPRWARRQGLVGPDDLAF